MVTPTRQMLIVIATAVQASLLDGVMRLPTAIILPLKRCSGRTGQDRFRRCCMAPLTLAVAIERLILIVGAAMRVALGEE